MISSKHFNKITIFMVSVALILSFLAMIFSEKLSSVFVGTDYNLTYASALFDTGEIISIDIVMDPEDWEEMLENAIDEEYYQCEVVINGTEFSRVGIRPKGNTSLSNIANDPDNDRYSFKLEFDQFVDGQTCWGLDKLALNNIYADNTYMKEAIIYDMYQYLGADASLYNYAKISVNGEYWGVYLALEAVEESFMVRNYGSENGHLYKPEGMNGGKAREDNENMEEMRKKIKDFQKNQSDKANNDETVAPENAVFPAEGETNGDMPQFDNSKMREQGGMPGGSGAMGGSGGANLNYSDDNLDSYSTIWDGEVTNSTEADHQKVVTALKNINEGTNLENYMDVDNILKYMAVHSFSVNDDSLSGNMAHNYYLYEGSGKLNIIPWDYNLAFGGMHGGNNASSVINDPIDSPFEATEFFDALLENEEYKAQYHKYYQQLVDEYIFGGRFEETYQRIRSQIDELVKTDPTAMCTYEEYEAAAEMLYDTVMLRGESVKGQLDGSIPSTTEAQQADSSAFVDASSIDVSVMGTMGGGHGGGMDRHFAAAEEETENDEEVKNAEINQENTKAEQREIPAFVQQQNQQSESNIDYKIIIISVGILLAAMILLRFIKRRN